MKMTNQIIEIAKGAGQIILSYYVKEIPVDYKSDNSPLTLADRAAHEYICNRLHNSFPEIPILSEESAPSEIEQRHSWQKFWLVDPLDGTKEFIKKSGQFTVNIALIESTVPTLGVIHVPVSGTTYYATKGGNAYVSETDEAPKAISIATHDPSFYTVVASKDHAGPQVASMLSKLPEYQLASMGSSLKFCLVAEGKADIYLRDVPTMEWDTGAAQCIVETAGGSITDLDGNRLQYNKTNLRNPSLITIGDQNLPWQQFI